MKFQWKHGAQAFEQGIRKERQVGKYLFAFDNNFTCSVDSETEKLLFSDSEFEPLTIKQKEVKKDGDSNS